MGEKGADHRSIEGAEPQKESIVVDDTHPNATPKKSSQIESYFSPTSMER
jgi:hypothetical protein